MEPSAVWNLRESDMQLLQVLGDIDSVGKWLASTESYIMLGLGVGGEYGVHVLCREVVGGLRQGLVIRLLDKAYRS